MLIEHNSSPGSKEVNSSTIPLSHSTKMTRDPRCASRDTTLFDSHGRFMASEQLLSPKTLQWSLTVPPAIEEFMLLQRTMR